MPRNASNTSRSSTPRGTASDTEEQSYYTSEDEAWLAKKKPKHGERLSQWRKLQYLVQPFFLAVGDSSGWHFVVLVLALLLCISGIAIIIASIAIKTLLHFLPELGSELERPDNFITDVWSSAWGVAVVLISVLSFLTFIAFRKQLKEGRWIPWLMLGSIVLVLLIVNGMNTSIGFIGKFLTNSLIAKEAEPFHKWLVVYGMCFVFAAPILTGQFWLAQQMGVIWRQWLSSNIIEAWMSNRAYYVLNPNDEERAEVDNPDQRISEDVRVFTDQMLSYIIGAFDSLLTLILNVAVLWSISPKLTVVLLVWSVGNTTALLITGRQLVNVNYSQLKVEADFRYGLVHIRDNAESIAFFRGEGQEKLESLRRLDTLVTNFNRLIRWKVLISVLQRLYKYGGVFIPYLIMAPLYLDGDQKYGDFVQATFAFNMVESGLSFIAESIEGMALWAAGITRLEGFQTSIEEVNCGALAIGKASKRMGSVITDDADASSISVHSAELLNPAGQLIVQDFNLSVERGETVLVAGTSGVGKTSLLRMISGLWVPRSGYVRIPPPGKIMFVPQKPYMILGNLREQLCYPMKPEEVSDLELQSIMQEVSLSHFVKRYPDLSVKQDWSRVFSLGEQQRISFGRLLLNRPTFAVLDEATSGLDVATEKRLYSLLKSRGVGYISVGHRPTLANFHDNVLQLRGEGAWSLIPTQSYSFIDHA